MQKAFHLSIRATNLISLTLVLPHIARESLAPVIIFVHPFPYSMLKDCVIPFIRAAYDGNRDPTSPGYGESIACFNRRSEDEFLPHLHPVFTFNALGAPQDGLYHQCM